MERSIHPPYRSVRATLAFLLAGALLLAMALAVAQPVRAADGDPIPPEGFLYTILPGDTLESIAARFGTTVAALMAANELPNPNLIYYYDQLLIVPPTYTGQPSEPPGTWPNCGWACTANDVVVNEIWFAKEDGSALDACTPGQPAQAWVWVNITNTNEAARYALTFLGDLYAGGVFSAHLEQCLDDTIAGLETVEESVATVQWTCGPTIEVRDPVVIWQLSDAATCPGTQVCADWDVANCYAGTAPVINGELAANFWAVGGCAGNPGEGTQFTSDVVGGTGPYAYLWNFGDGGGAGAANPIHTYAFPGTYTVTLTVTDAAAPTHHQDVAIRRVMVGACPVQPPQPPPTGSIK